MIRLLLFLPPTDYICIRARDWHQTARGKKKKNWHEETNNCAKLREVWHGFHLRNPVVLMASHSWLLCVIKLNRTNNYRDQFNLPLNHNASIAQCNVKPGANCTATYHCLCNCAWYNWVIQSNQQTWFYFRVISVLSLCVLLLACDFCWWMSKCWHDPGWFTNFIYSDEHINGQVLGLGRYHSEPPCCEKVSFLSPQSVHVLARADQILGNCVTLHVQFWTGDNG